MDSELLQDILSCSSLPSLPAVAVRVLELTSDPDVRMDELASTIQADQALAAKILRTVNSSFYGLRKRCTSIDKALVLLGLGPVKSLVLGFSLVTAVGKDDADGFDFVDYWRRGLETAVSGKLLADHCSLYCADEAFLAGLFQDIGMVAMHRALGQRYNEVLASVARHADLTRAEIKAFEGHHAEIGAALAESWHLPPDLVVPVKFHDRPTACPTEYSMTARCVAVGNLVHEVLIAEEPTEALRELYQRAERLLNLNEEGVDRLVREAGEAARELGSLFELDTSTMPNPKDVLAKADRQLIKMARERQIESFAVRELSGVLSGDKGRDALTGLLDRESFGKAVRKAFPKASEGEIDLSLVQFAVDGLSDILSRHGQQAQDELVLGATVLLLRVFEPMGGIVARVNDTDFAVVLPGTNRRSASDAAQAVCDQFGPGLERWLPDATDAGRSVHINAGVATIDAETAGAFITPDLLVAATSRAVQAARGAGGACARVFVPRSKAA
ncbi:MAG: HDOD domain-containing protein [Phycisphaerales bacterium]|nr:HDOD domain-containing protein [Planctomycetota bacterium]MCH8508201.1 HDOD domain-containing protein [Phycisphaerales bacterium]